MLRAVLHGRKPQATNALPVIRRNKAQMTVDLHCVGRRVNREDLMGIVTAHGRKQLFADSPAVIGRIHKEAADVLGRAHGQYAHERFSVKGTVKIHLPVALGIIQTGSKSSDSFG